MSPFPGPHRVRRIQRRRQHRRRRQAGPVHGRATGARTSEASPSRCCDRARAAPSRRRSPLRSGRTRRSGAGRAASAAGSPRYGRWRPLHLSRNRQGFTQESMSLTRRARPRPAADERTRTPRRTCGSPTRSVAFLFSAPAVAPCQAEFVLLGRASLDDDGGAGERCGQITLGDGSLERARHRIRRDRGHLDVFDRERSAREPGDCARDLVWDEQLVCAGDEYGREWCIARRRNDNKLVETGAVHGEFHTTLGGSREGCRAANHQCGGGDGGTANYGKPAFERHVVPPGLGLRCPVGEKTETTTSQPGCIGAGHESGHEQEVIARRGLYFANAWSTVCAHSPSVPRRQSVCCWSTCPRCRTWRPRRRWCWTSS